MRFKAVISVAMPVHPEATTMGRFAVSKARRTPVAPFTRPSTKRRVSISSALRLAAILALVLALGAVPLRQATGEVEGLRQATRTLVALRLAAILALALALGAVPLRQATGEVGGLRPATRTLVALRVAAIRLVALLEAELLRFGSGQERSIARSWQPTVMRWARVLLTTASPRAR